MTFLIPCFWLVFFGVTLGRILDMWQCRTCFRRHAVWINLPAEHGAKSQSWDFLSLSSLLQILLTSLLLHQRCSVFYTRFIYIYIFIYYQSSRFLNSKACVGLCFVSELSRCARARHNGNQRCHADSGDRASPHHILPVFISI